MKYKKDYYQILGVKPNATAMEIRRSYRRLAILNHPDKNPTPQATTRMQEINEAYDVIGDGRKRAKYDSEYPSPSFTAPPNKSSYNKDTSNLQQFSAEDFVVPVSKFFNIIFTVIFPLLFFTIIFPLLFMSFLSSRFVTEAPFASIILGLFPSVLLGMFPALGISILWRNFKSFKNETKCPRCGNLWAAEKLNEKLIGVFEGPLGSNYGKYKMHYKCKYCKNEWLFLKSRKQ